MPHLHLIVAFLAATAVFACIPGPAMLYTAARTIAAGRRAGFMAVLGIHVGGYAHVITAAAGLSVLFRAVPVAYLAVKLAGAAYLIWLGFKMVRAQPDAQGSAPEAMPRSARQAFLESITVEVLNPKTALFFLAFLPQFVDPTAGAPVWLQFGLYGMTVNLIFSVTDVLCVLLAATVAARLRRSGRAQRLMRRLGGTVLIGLGGHVALQGS